MEVVTGPLPRVIAKLSDLLIGEYDLRKGVKEQIMSLKAELERIHPALTKISEAMLGQLDNQTKFWAREVVELSYDIEDTVDAIMVPESNELAKSLSFKRFIHKSVLLGRARVRHHIAEQIRDIKSHTIDLQKRHSRYNSSSLHVNEPATATYPPSLPRQIIPTELVGIDEPRDNLIKVLEEGNKHQGKIVSVVGFGGLGKTTLAISVYEMLRRQFDCWAFVSVSQNPDMNALFKNMFYQLGVENNSTIIEASEETHLIYELRKFLEEKRYKASYIYDT
jgi:hypothetical protein